MILIEISATLLSLLQGFFALLNKKSNRIFYMLQMWCMIVFSLKINYMAMFSTVVVIYCLVFTGLFFEALKKLELQNVQNRKR